MPQLDARMKAALRKGMIVGAVSGVLSVLVLDGMQGVHVFGHVVPKFVMHTAVLGTSSIVAEYTIPMITPYLAGGDVRVTRFENLALSPLLIGVISLGLESVLSPEAEVRGGVLKTIGVGAASAITSSYFSSGMGWEAPLA